MKTSFFSTVLRKRVVTAAAIALTLPFLAPVAQAQNLNGAGATFPLAIYTKWFDVYQKQTGVKINYQGVGFGASRASNSSRPTRSISPVRTRRFPTRI